MNQRGGCGNGFDIGLSGMNSPGFRWLESFGAVYGTVAGEPLAFQDPAVRLLRFSRPDNGRDVWALYRPPCCHTTPILIYFHGLGQQLAGVTTRFVELLGSLGYGVLAMEYPGSGLALKAPHSEKAICEDAEFLVQTAANRFGSDRIVLVGFSLGTGVVVDLGVKGYGRRLVLLAPFTSVSEVLRHHIPVLHPQIVQQLVGQDRFDSQLKAPAIQQPTLIVHGTLDEIVPFWMGRKLANLIPNATLAILHGAPHSVTGPVIAHTTAHIIKKWIR
jgi:pimeloyl-ACP methyl ester carboxylesterase